MANASMSFRYRFVRVLAAALLLIVLCITLVAVNADSAQSVAGVKPTVGLVNEDLSAEFNGNQYTFGTSFVDRISKDSDYNWVVLSRPVAEKAYNDSSVDAILYIPQSFTRDILTLQELSPTKATIEYKLQRQADERADQLLDNKIIAIVHGFNEGIIKMYYASLADNLAEADGQMHATLSNQEALITALTANVQEPFSGTLPNIENFVSSATGLKDVNAATVEARNSFTKSVTDSLTSNSEALTSQLPTIEEYVRRQQKIAQTNLTNSNKAVADQAAADLGFYSGQFATFKTSTLCKLTGLDAADSPEPCTLPDGTIPAHLAGRLAELQQLITQYNEDQGPYIEDLYAELDTRIKNLKAIESQLTNSPDPTDPPTPTDPAVPTDPAGTTDPAGNPPLLGISIDPIILASLQAEILALETSRDSLNNNAPALDAAIANLNTWYAETIASIKDTTLAANTVGGLEVSDWSKYSPELYRIYTDGRGGDIGTNISELISQMAQTGSQITSNSTTVPDNSSQFDALLQSANTTFKGAGNVFNGLNDLVSTGNDGLEENQSYYANFTKVLANTRTPGVDSSSIYDFFAAPISAKNITPERTAAASIITNPISWLDLKWAAIFGGGILAGIIASILGGAFRRKKA